MTVIACSLIRAIKWSSITTAKKRKKLLSKMITFVYRGGGRDTVPRDATHVIIHESVKAISARAFKEHPNIVEVYCHAGVKKIERAAFNRCLRLKKVIMPGVEAVECGGFCYCQAIEYVECGKLEQIGSYAFLGCDSLSSIDLQSAKVIGRSAFDDCDAMTEAKFGANLKSVDEGAFRDCKSLERVLIPLKNGLIRHDDIFQGCENFRRIDLMEAEMLDQTIAALHLEEWRNDMTAEVSSINQTLLNTFSGYYNEEEDEEVMGEMTIVIRDWIYRVLSKIRRYRAQHHHLLNKAATALQFAAPNDIVVDNVIPFLELPPHTFDGEED